MLNLRNEQRGDTIVEVLIAIAVVSLVLVTAYKTTVRNVNGVQDTQEHSEALQLAQAQLEFLHNASAMPADGQCFGMVAGSASYGQPTSTNCNVDASGAPTNTQPEFNLAIKNVSVSANSPTYQIAVTWPSLVSSSTNNVTLYYQP